MLSRTIGGNDPGIDNVMISVSPAHILIMSPLQVGPYVRLELGQERAFFIDDGALSHAFVPCGHVTTERTAESVTTTLCTSSVLCVLYIMYIQCLVAIGW